MKTVTAIQPQRGGSRGRVDVFLDGSFAFSLSSPVVAEAGLHTGKALSPSEVKSLRRADSEERLWSQALRLLGVRPRSRAELRDRLLRGGADRAIVGRVLRRLEAQGLVDDGAFARFWAESRHAFNPRSPRLLSLELRQKGVPPEAIAQAVEGVDEDEEALRAARRRLRGLQGLGYAEFRRRLGARLRRRGFGYETIARIIDRIWGELFPEDLADRT